MMMTVGSDPGLTLKLALRLSPNIVGSDPGLTLKLALRLSPNIVGSDPGLGISFIPILLQKK
jgi:hypothetical protein